MPNKKIFILFIAIAIFSGCGLSQITTPPQQDTTALMKKFHYAQEAFNSQDYELAKKLYTEFIANSKDTKYLPVSYLKLALITEQTDKKQALKLYLKIINQYTNSDAAVDACIQASNILIEQAKYKKAVSLCSAILKSYIADSQKIRVLFMRAKIYQHQLEYLAAIEDYNHIHSLDPERYEVIRPKIAEAASQMDNESLLKASAIFLNNDAIALFKKYYSLNLIKENKLAQAKEVLKNIIDDYPDTKTAEEAKLDYDQIKNKDKIKIGCILPLSGQFQQFGEMALKAIQLALSEFSAQNPDIHIKLIIENNQSSEKGSKKAAQKLIEKEVSAIIGPFHTAETAAVEAQENMIPIMVMTHKTDITKDRDFVFRNFITPKMQASALVSYAKNELKINKFAVLYPDEPYGKNFMNAFWDAAVQYNCRITGAEKYSPDASDYTDSIKKLTGLYYKGLREIKPKEEEKQISENELTEEDQDKNEEELLPEEDQDQLEPIINFNAIFIPDGPNKVGLLAPQLAYYDVVNVLYLGPNLWKNGNLIQNSEGYIKKAIFTALFYNESEKYISKKFTETYSSVFGNKPEFVEAISYDTAMFIFTAAKKAQSPSPKLIRDSIIATPSFNGVTGQTVFNLNGECSKEIILIETDSRGTKELTKGE